MHAHPMAGRAADLEGAAGQYAALTHPPQPPVTIGGIHIGRQYEASAIIADRHMQAVRVIAESEIRPARLGVDGVERGDQVVLAV
jgi:hypothetical protein